VPTAQALSQAVQSAEKVSAEVAATLDGTSEAAGVDSTITFADVDAAFTAVNLIDSLKVDDSLLSMTVTTTLKGPTLPRVDIPPADSGILAFGVGIRADQGTGIRIGSPGLAPPSFRSFITIPSGDTTLPQQITRGLLFGRFVSQSAPSLDPSLLTIGGMPSARSLIRFPWSTFLRDSAQLVRVTLELVPAAPIVGLRADTAFIIARPLLADFGSKSPASTSSFFTSTVALADTTRDTVRFEVLRAATQWQGSNPTPSAFMMQLSPEGSSFTRATFGSTRTPGLVARLRVTYANKFPFEAP
jgi:hypothetical protein